MERIECTPEEAHGLATNHLVEVLSRIALGDQRPGHVHYLTKAEMATIAWHAVVRETGIDPTGAAEKEEAAYVAYLEGA